MKRAPKEATQTGEAKAAHMLKRLKDRPRKQVPLADYYTSYSPAPPLHTADPSLPTSTTMNTKRDYQMQPERRYEPRPEVADPRDRHSVVNYGNDPRPKVEMISPQSDPRQTTKEVLLALGNDLRTTEPQVAEWCDYLARRIGG